MILIRLVLQTVVLALAQIWANKVRAALTALGIIIGVAAVIATVAATDGLRAAVLKEFETFGARKVFIDGRVPRGQRGQLSRAQVELSLREVEQVTKQAVSFDRWSPLFFMGYDLQWNETLLRGVSVLGIWPDWHDIESRYTSQGRPFSSVDEEQRRNVCLINDKTIELLGLPREPVGEFLLIGGRRFQIVGVIESRQLGPLFGGDEAQAEAFVPLSVAMAMNPQRRFVNFLLGNLKSTDLAEEGKAEVSFLLRRMRAIKPGQEDTFEVGVVQSVIEQFNRVAQGITAAAGGIVAISLLVGGIGIMNIMLVSVSERTREIGLRKAVGAQPAVVLIQFLIEAVVLCVFGGAIGLAIGFGIILGLRFIPNSPLADAAVPYWAMGLGFGFSATVGIVFGMFPAIKAARLDPIDALRHE